MPRIFCGEIESPEGQRYGAHVQARLREDGRLEARIVFVSRRDGTELWTRTETTQSRLEHLVRWASGLSRIYLEGALDRARALAREKEKVSRARDPIEGLAIWSLN